MYRKILCFLLMLTLATGTAGCSSETAGAGGSSTESEAAATEAVESSETFSDAEDDSGDDFEDDSEYESENYDCYPASVPETEGLLELTLVHFDDNAEESTQTLQIGMTVAEYMEAMDASYDDLNFLYGEDGEPYDPQTDLLEPGMTRKVISSDDMITLYIRNMTEEAVPYSEASVISLDIQREDDCWFRFLDREPFTVTELVEILGRDFECSLQGDSESSFFTWTNSYGSVRFEVLEEVRSVVLTMADASLNDNDDPCEIPEFASKEEFYAYLMNGLTWGETESEADAKVNELLANGVEILGVPVDQVKYDGACIEDEVRITGIHYKICEPCGTAAENCLLYRIVRVLGEPSYGILYEYITEDTGSFVWEDGDISVHLGRDWVNISNYGLYEDE